MPTYEYKREDGTTFEVWQGINDEPLEECPDTGQKVRRLISGGGGVVYKGEGFYVTDYKKNKDQQSNGSGQSSSSDAKQENTDTSDSGNESNSKSQDTTSDSWKLRVPPSIRIWLAYLQ